MKSQVHMKVCRAEWVLWWTSVTWVLRKQRQRHCQFDPIVWATWGDFALKNMLLCVSEMETVGTKDTSNEKPWVGDVALLAKLLPSNYQALCLSPSTINWVRWSVAPDVKGRRIKGSRSPSATLQILGQQWNSVSKQTTTNPKTLSSGWRDGSAVTSYTAFAENPGFVPSTYLHQAAHNRRQLQVQGSDALFWLPWEPAFPCNTHRCAYTYTIRT